MDISTITIATGPDSAVAEDIQPLRDWNAIRLKVGDAMPGGTAITSLPTVGAMPYVSATDVMSMLTPAAGVLQWTGAGVAPTITQAPALTRGLFTQGTITTNLPTIDALVTWNNAGVTFTGLRYDVTDTASGASSLLLDLKVGGVSQWTVSKGGMGTLAGGLICGSITASANIIGAVDIYAGAARWIGLNGRSLLSSAVNGNLLISNFAVTDFGLLQFGGTSASFPALKRSATTLQARLADDSAFATLAALNVSIGATARNILTGAGTPEGAVTASVGSIYLRNDGGAGTSLYVKETGAGNTGWVGK